MSFVVTRCQSLYHSLPLDVSLVCLFKNDLFIMNIGIITRVRGGSCTEAFIGTYYKKSCVLCVSCVLLFHWDSANFFGLKKIPGTFVLKRYKRKISKLEKDTHFFNSASVLLNFFTNRASNVTYVLLNKYNHCHTETLFIFSVFLSMSRTRFINVVSLWFLFQFHLHFHYD